MQLTRGNFHIAQVPRVTFRKNLLKDKFS